MVQQFCSLVHIAIYLDICWASMCLSKYLCAPQMSIYLLCTRYCWALCPVGINYYSYLDVFLSSAIVNLYSRCLFLFSVFSLWLTTTPLVTFVCSRVSPIIITYNGSTSVALAAFGQHDVPVPPQLTLKDIIRCSVGHYQSDAAATTTVPDAFSGICQLCHESFSSEFSLSELSLPLINYISACYGVCLLLLGSHVAAMLTNGGWLIRVSQSHNPMQYTHGRYMCLLVMAHGPYKECIKWLFPPLFPVGEPHAAHSAVHPAIPSIWWGIQLLGLSRMSSDPFTFSTWCGGVFFSRLCSVWLHGRLNLWWVLNLVILVWWLGISDWAPGWQSTSLFDLTFTLVSWARWQH